MPSPYVESPLRDLTMLRASAIANLGFHERRAADCRTRLAAINAELTARGVAFGNTTNSLSPE